MPKTTLGRLSRESIRLLEIPRPTKAVIPAYQLPPVYFTKRIVGPAMTLRNIARDVQIHKAAQEKL